MMKNKYDNDDDNDIVVDDDGNFLSEINLSCKKLKKNKFSWQILNKVL
jgi:hypothetical protein